jgi:hypothetical protein
MRIVIKDQGQVKPPGFCFGELKGRVHVFLVGDCTLNMRRSTSIWGNSL